MAYTKKTWVNVSDPSNPPSIPEGQDALARFDADNMNRIEDGIAKAMEDLPKKAPEGHGLGGIAKEVTNVSFFETLKRGGGFYQVASAEDTPATGEASRLNLIQCVRSAQENMETGVQLAFYDWIINNPRFWMRNVLKGTPGNWVEMLHTGNISNYANARITTGSYVGVVSGEAASEVVLSFDFEPKLIILQGKASNNQSNTATFLHGCDGNHINVYASNSVSSNTISTIWEGNSVKLALEDHESKKFNWSGNTYTYVAMC